MRFLLLLALLSACGHFRGSPMPVVITNPVLVKVENPPPVKPSCYIDDPPIPPEEISLDLKEEDVVRRVFVHIRQYNEIVVWAHATQAWMSDLKLCLETEVLE